MCFYMQRDAASSGKGRNGWNLLIKWGGSEKKSFSQCSAEHVWKQ